MLHISDKFQDQNQQQKSDITFYANEAFTPSVTFISFPSDFYPMLFHNKAFHTQKILKKPWGFLWT